MGVTQLWLLIRPYLNAILVTLANAVPGFSTILQFFNAGNPTSWSNKVLANTGASVADLENITYGLAALHAQLTTIGTAVGALGSPQQTGDPVTLPPTAPTGYGGGSSGDIAATVWDYVLPSSDQRAGDALAGVGMEAQARGEADAMVQLGNSPLIGIMGTWDALQTHPYRPHFPYPDVRNILTADTLLTWLNREDTLHTWTMDDTGFAMTDVQDVDSSWRFVCLLSPADFELQKGAASVSIVNAPPVWPGYAHVTLGTPVDLVDGLIVEYYMHGVIIHLTSVPTTRGRYIYGDLTAWLNIGALTFIDDGGQAEGHQALNFVDQVYCPKTMVRAQFCKFRVAAGVVGTVTPWITTA